MKNHKIIVACVIIILIMLIAVTVASNPHSEEEHVTVSTGDESDAGNEREVERVVEEKAAQQHAQDLRGGDDRLSWDVRHWLEEDDDAEYGEDDEDYLQHWMGVNPFRVLRDADMDDVLRFMWPSRQRNFLFDRSRRLRKPYPKRATLFDRIRHARDDMLDKMGRYIGKFTGGSKMRDNRHQDHHRHRHLARADLRQVENGNAYELIVDVPGMDKQDIRVRIVEDFDPWSRSVVDVLEVEGRRKHELRRTDGGELQWEQRQQLTRDSSKPETTTTTTETVESESEEKRPRHRYIYTERSIGQFQRKFLLPKRVLKNKVHATLKNGILTVRVPIDPKEHQSTPSITNIDIE